MGASVSFTSRVVVPDTVLFREFDGQAVILNRDTESYLGLEAELRLGVGKPEGEFAAHAWVEHGGVALGEPENAARTFAAPGGALLSNGT